MAWTTSGSHPHTPGDVENKQCDENDECGKKESPCRKINLFEKIVEKCENLIIYSLLHLRSSPLEALIGPGASTNEGYTLVHACYFVIVSFIPIAYVIANLPGIKTYIGKDVNICVFVENPDSCVEIVSSIFANRFSLAVTSLFTFMALITMKCFVKNDHVQPSLSNGFWILKLSLIFLASLVAFSIPPAQFDVIWHYICVAASLLQSILITFLLIDLTNDMFINSQYSNSQHQSAKQKTIGYSITLILTLLSTTAFIYTSYSALNESGLMFSNAFSLMLSITFIICMCFLVKKDTDSIAQSFFILGFLMLRLGLSQGYESTTNKSILSIYLLVDTVLKLTALIYALFREMMPNHYEFGGSQIYGRISSVYSNAGFSEKNCNIENMCEQYKVEKIGHSDTNSMENLQDSYMRSKDADKQHLETKDTNGMASLKLSLQASKPFIPENEKHLAIQKPTTKAPSYSFTFLHVFLLITSLDLNSNLTSFHVLVGTGSYFEVNRSMFSVAILKLSTAAIAIIFVWTRVVGKIYKNVNEFSSFTLLVTLARSITELFYKIMVEPPKCNAIISNMKYLYTGIFTSSIIASFVVLSPKVKQMLEKSTLFCSHKTTKGFCLSADPSLVALYRISISTSTLFFIMSVLLLGVSSVANPRNKLHHGFWPTKVLLLGLTFITAFYVPLEFDRIWKHFALAATLVVTLIQVVIVLDCTSQLIAHFHIQDETSSKKANRIYFSCSSIAIFLYTMALTAFFCFYVYFAQFSVCKSNRIFICINLGLCIMASVISLHPSVQDGGLVQSAVVTSFCMYCTWSALYNNPREECNPMAHEIFETELKPTKTTLFIVDFMALVITLAYVTIYTVRIQEFFQRFASVCCRFRCLNSASGSELPKSSTDLQKVGFRQVLLGYQYQQVAISMHSDVNRPKISYPEADEKISDPVPYSYSLLHLMYAFLSMHAFILLITWVEERPGSHIKISFHWTVMCIKIVSSSTSVLLYTWSLVVHLFLKNINKS